MSVGVETMRVLMLTPAFPPAVGGAELLAERLVSNFEHSDCRVLSLDTEGAEASDADSAIDVWRAPNEPEYGRRSLGRLSLAALRVGPEFEPDVVLSMHLRCGAAAWALRRRTGARWVQYFHAKELGEWPRQATFAARRADHSIAVSSYTRELALAAGADPERLSVVPPGVADAPPRTHERESRPTFVTLARMADPYKGHDVLIDALPRILERVPDAAWVVVGDGRLRKRWEDEVAARRLAAHVRFLGQVDDGERDAWLERAHLFALPARVPPDGRGGEGFGIVFLEAAARGLATVGGAEGGVVDAVRHGETGLLVDPRDAGAVAEAIGDLLLDPVRAEALGRAGRDFAREFSWRATARRVEELLAAC